MNPEAQRVRDVFVAAVKLAPEQWPAFLEGACAGDEELHSRVSELLREHQQAGSFLDRPAPHLGATGGFAPAGNGAAGGQEGPGTRVGPYKLLELIGEGGMGAVWMAEQREPVQRRVALKIIKAGMDTRQVVARFEAERQALALMDHPNIAKVFDGGTTAGGRPYFVMELVKGTPITRYCDEHQLTPKERLELFVPVCQAIQHAHQKGIIHRDVKPANVLVAPYDGAPVPKVIDFGVAKAVGQRLTERTLFTSLGAVVGTPEYMSPEQAELNNHDIDTRSDIYGLGVLLYELLTGTTPLTHERLQQAAFTEILRAIREEEPPRPSMRLSESKDTLPAIAARRHTEPARLTKLVRGELDWIVMKALEKDRRRRYETASGLARDVEHYLADEPVQACPPSAGYRLRKLVRRNKGPLLAAGLVLLALVAGIIGTTLGLLQARAATGAERSAKEAQTAQRLRAEENAKLAVAVLDEIIMKEARRRIALYTEEEGIGVARNPERDKVEREFLEKGLKFYERLTQTNGADWAARRERARAYANVGLLRRGMRNYHPSEEAYRSESENAYRQAIALMEELAGERPDDFDNAYDLANAYLGLVQPLLDAGRLQAAEETIRRALALYERLAADCPERRSQTQEGRGYCYWKLAHLFRLGGKPEDFAKTVRQSLGIWAELLPVNPDVPEFWDDVARAHSDLACWPSQQFDAGEAENEHRQAVAIWEKLSTKWPQRHDFYQHAAWACARIGEFRVAARKPREAEDFYRRALQAFEKLIANYPGNPFYREEKAQTLELLAGALKDAGRAREADEAHQQALALYTQVLAVYPAESFKFDQEALLAQKFAHLLKDAGRPREAEKAYRLALAIFGRLTTEAPGADYRWHQADCTDGLGQMLLQQGKHVEAAKLAEKTAGALLKDPSGYQRAALLLTRCAQLAEEDEKLPGAPRKAAARAYAGRLRGLQQNAREVYAQAIAGAEKLVSESPGVARHRDQLAAHRTNLVTLLKAMGRTQEVEDSYRQAIAFHARLAGAHPDLPELRDALAGSHFDLGQVLGESRQLAQAEQAYRQALAVWEKLPADSPGRRSHAQEGCQWNLLLVLQKADKREEAEKAFRQLTAIWAELIATSSPVPERRADLAHLIHARAYGLHGAGRLKESEEAYRQALAIWEKLAADRPDSPEYPHRAAYVHSMMAHLDWSRGNLLKGAAKPKEAEGAYRRALGVFEKLIADNPAEPFWRCEQAYNYCLLAELFKDTGRAQEAEKAYRRAVAPLEKLVADFPNNGDYRSRLSGCLGALAESLLQQGKHAEAAKAAEKMAGALPRDATGYQSAALVLARCVALAEKDAGLPEADRKALARAYAERSSERMREALTVTSKAIERGGKDAGLWARRGQLYCELGQWDKAAADYARATEVNPKSPLVWYQYAMVRLGAADAKGYRGVCAGILERFGKTEDPDTAYWVAWPCVLVPDAVTRPAPLVPLAEKAVARAPTNYDYLTTLGAALYRAGRFGEAVKRLGEAAAAYKPGPGCRQPLAYSWFFLAMAHHRLGHAEEARKWLDTAVRWTDRAGPGKGKGTAGTVPMPWNRRLTLQLLRREAETLVRGAATQK